MVGRTSRTWEKLASHNALRAIVDAPEGDSLETFLASGAREVTGMFQALESAGIAIRAERALDFGCGAGRLSIPLASRFAHVTGIDASPTMVQLAHQLAARERAANVDFRVSRSPQIDIATGSQDFVLSLITLQHLPATVQARYVTEFARILAPGGIAVFQVITDHADEPTSWLRRGYRRALPQRLRNAVRRVLRPGRAAPEIYCISHRKLLDTIAQAGAETIVEVNDGAAPGWESRRLAVRRP